jgi:hypothetical protein
MKAHLTKTAKLARALALRDAGLTVVRRMGLWEAVGVGRRATSGAGEMKLLAWAAFTFPTVPYSNKCRRQTMRRGISCPHELSEYAGALPGEGAPCSAVAYRALRRGDRISSFLRAA